MTKTAVMESTSKELSRGPNWTFEETMALIECWSEESIEHELSLTHRNKHVYEKISNALERRGVDRSWESCRIKIKGLRQIYLKTTTEESRSKFPFYDRLDEFLGSKPSTYPASTVISGESIINGGPPYKACKQEISPDNTEQDSDNEFADNNFADNIYAGRINGNIVTPSLLVTHNEGTSLTPPGYVQVQKRKCEDKETQTTGGSGTRTVIRKKIKKYREGNADVEEIEETHEVFSF